MYMREYILGRRISGEMGTVRHSESWVQLLKQLTVVSARNKRIFSKYQLSSLDLRANLNSGVPDIRTSGHPEFQPNNRLDLLLLGLCLLGHNNYKHYAEYDTSDHSPTSEVRYLSFTHSL